MQGRGRAVGHPTGQVGDGCACAGVAISGIGRTHHQPHRNAAPCRPSDKGRTGGEILTFQGDACGRGIRVVDQTLAKRTCASAPRAAAGCGHQINRLPTLLRAQAVSCGIIPDITVLRANWIAGALHHVNAARCDHAARGRFNCQPRQKGRAIGADLQHKVVAAHDAHFGPSGIAALKQHAGRVRRARLVDLNLMPRARMGQQSGRGRNA